MRHLPSIFAFLSDESTPPRFPFFYSQNDQLIVKVAAGGQTPLKAINFGSGNGNAGVEALNYAALTADNAYLYAGGRQRGTFCARRRVIHATCTLLYLSKKPPCSPTKTTPRYHHVSHDARDYGDQQLRQQEPGHLHEGGP